MKMNKKSNSRIPKKERGDAVLEMAAMFPILALFISAMISMGPFIHMKIAVQQAAYDCALSAAQSLDRKQGHMQGVVAAQESFATFGLPYENIGINILGNWERGGQIVCTVSFNIPKGNFPMALVVPLPDSVFASTVLPAQQWKSLWR